MTRESEESNDQMMPEEAKPNPTVSFIPELIRLIAKTEVK